MKYATCCKPYLTQRRLLGTNDPRKQDWYKVIYGVGNLVCVGQQPFHINFEYEK